MTAFAKALREANVQRCEESFHPVADWSPDDWLTAVLGEVGEIASELKRLRRDSRGLQTAEWRRAISYEMADVITYLDLLAARMALPPLSLERPKIDCAPVPLSKFQYFIVQRLSRLLDWMNRDKPDQQYAVREVVGVVEGLAKTLDIDLRTAIIDKFAIVSKRVGSKVVLSHGTPSIRYRCTVCGALSKGRTPPGGDGSLIVPRPHKYNGRPCSGALVGAAKAP